MLKVRASIISTLDSAVTAIKSAREQIHQCLIMALSGKTGFFVNGTRHELEYILDTLEQTKGFRVQAVIYWLEGIAGVRVEKENDSYKVSKIKDKDFKFDAAHMAECKDKKNRFWDYAPDEKPVSIPAIGASWALIMARGLEVGSITEDDIQKFIASLPGEVNKLRKDSKIIKFKEKFAKDHPDYVHPVVEQPESPAPEQQTESLVEAPEESALALAV